jgi:hypothetical protein
MITLRTVPNVVALNLYETFDSRTFGLGKCPIRSYSRNRPATVFASVARFNSNSTRALSAAPVGTRRRYYPLLWSNTDS